MYVPKNKRCLYYNQYVPLDLVNATKNIEHIVPWSISRWTEGKELDLDRLGNIVLIDEQTNKKRGNKPLTPQFIDEHKLYYYNYPSQEDYNNLGITNDNIMKNSTAYKKLCDEREEKYITSILKCLYP